MTAPRWTHSLKWRIVASYSLILILGGVSTSYIGIRVTGRALLLQARQQVDHGLAAARYIYQSRLHELRQCVELLASSGYVQLAVGGGEQTGAIEYLTEVRRDRRLDFLSVADPTGRAVLRTAGPRSTGDVVAHPDAELRLGLAPVVRALAGDTVASTEIVPLGILREENPVLAERASIEFERETATSDVERLTAGMVMLAAAPVRDRDGKIIAVLYAGRLLNGSAAAEPHGAHDVVDRVRETLFPESNSPGQFVGAATIFQDGIRVTTNLMTVDGRRAIGTRVADEVYNAVMVRGGKWNDRAFALNDWYITAYEPITNLAGERVGILGVGLLQRPYTAVRDNVTLAFAAIALLCFALIVIVTYFLTRSLVRPLENMVGVSREIAAGNLMHRVEETSDQSELGVLSNSFNAMLDRIHDMNKELERWARMLEEKVKERTEQLAKTQAAMDRQQRLASLGQLAAGVAHEINNPLGGILTFASLIEEEIPEDSPIREDVEEIVRQAVRCRTIVQQLLEFSRQREARTAPHSINELVKRTLALLEKQASFQDIQITQELDPESPVTIADESQLQQVIMNVVLNAKDAMNERGKLTVTTGHNADAREVFVRFTDNGCGIPETMREAIFDPFFTTKAPGKGTGLGLAVAARIVQAHRGRMDVESDVGRGTSFTVVLPLSAERAEEEMPPAE